VKAENWQELIRYRLERSHETLEEALLMQRESHWNTCVNRLYYACFYAVTALLAIEGLDTGKHSGVKSLFNRYWVKTNKISKRHGRLYNNLFENRQEGDYIDFVSFDKDTVAPWIPQVADFIDTVDQLIKGMFRREEEPIEPKNE